jgi:diguanylate cyclase
VRWNHPERGLLLPGAFLPQLDRAGLAALTQRVLELALADCGRWREVLPACRVSVNVPPVLLRDPWLPAWVSAALQAAGLPPEALELEVTEEAISDDAHANPVTAELRAAGVRMAIDGFGEGTTSLDTLRRHDVDVLRIGRRFLDGGLRDCRDRAVVRALTTLGHELGLAVTAAGVEDAAAFDALASMGVDEVQGTVFARPLPLDRLLAFLDSHDARATMPLPLPRQPLLGESISG